MNWISKHRVLSVAVLFVLAVSLLWFLLYLFVPPFFVQMGANHFAGGPDAWSITGIYTCEVPGDPTCVPIREGLFEAFRNDPDIRNWWPIKISAVDL